MLRRTSRFWSSQPGLKSKVGGIDELLGADGLGEYLVDFDTSKETEIDACSGKRLRNPLKGLAPG